MDRHTLIIMNVDEVTEAGKLTLTLADPERAKFALKPGVAIQLDRPASIKFTDLQLTEQEFTFTRTCDDVNAPWKIILCIDTDQASIQLRSHKEFRGVLVYLLDRYAADHHRDALGPITTITLHVQPPPRIAPP